MNQGTERAVSRTVVVIVAAFAGFLVLGTVFGDAEWVGRMYLVAWALLSFFAVAMGFVVYFEQNVLTDDEEDASTPEPLAVLRERYARGEVDEAEFERKTERLLETEHADDREPLRASAGADESDRRTTRR